MDRIRYRLLILILMACTFNMNAQNDEIMIGLRAGHNAAFGGFGAFSIETMQDLKNNFQISGGVQYNTIGKTALEARPAYLIDYRWGRLSFETLLAYRNLTSVNSFAAGAGAEISGRWIAVKLGYYYHLYGHRGDSIKEPFNIYYELRADLLPMMETWGLELIITNNERFELERHYQPSFIAQGSYELNDSLGLRMGIGCKPAGMFHLSADYYQSFLNLGVFYRW